MRARHHGFTLVELAVVLVVIGLLVGAVTVGKQLLDNAGRQAVIADIERYKNAIVLFKEKYKYLPGDFPYAEDYWSQDTQTTPSFAELLVASAHAKQHFKHFPYMGDHQVGGPGSGPLHINPDEALQVWTHLVAAGMIEGNYTGQGTHYYPGQNVPKSSYKNGGYSFSFFGNVRQKNGVYDGQYGHALVYGSPYDGTGGMIEISYPINGPVINSSDAMDIDSKADDGNPGTGNVRSYTTHIDSPTPNCADGETADAIYDLSSDELACSLIFVTGF